MLKSLSVFSMMLVSLNLFSQIKIENRTSITVSKIYNEPNDGPCNSFINKQGASIISKKVTDCDSLVLKFLNLKHDLKTRKHAELCCQEGFLGCLSIENMIVLEFNKLIDTLYFNDYKSEKTIVDFRNHKEYTDDNDELKMLLKDVDSLVGGFEWMETESSANDDWAVVYSCHDSNKDTYNTYHFYKDRPVSRIIIRPISNPENYISDDPPFIMLNDLKIGDNEEKLIKKFPNSTKFIENQKTYFPDSEGNYDCLVKLADSKGHILFVLNNRRIIRIEVTFLYNRE